MTRAAAVWARSALLVAVALSGGCLGAGQYRSARTLEPGEMDVGANTAIAQVYRGSVAWSDGTGGKTREASARTLVSGLEFHAHRGIVEDVEAGVRLVPWALGAEIDGKWRFYKQDRLHVAGSVLLGKAFAAAVEHWRALAQVLATWDLTPPVDEGTNWALTGGLTAGARGVAVPAPGVHTDADKLDDLRLSVGTGGFLWGGGIGFERRTESWYLRPTVDVTRYHGEVGDGRYGITFVQITVSVGWTFGKELAQFKRAQDQLDRIAPGAQ